MIPDYKPDNIPQDIWDVCYYAWLEAEDKAPSQLNGQDVKAIKFAAYRVMFNKDRKWESSVSSDNSADHDAPVASVTAEKITNMLVTLIGAVIDDRGSKDVAEAIRLRQIELDFAQLLTGVVR